MSVVNVCLVVVGCGSLLVDCCLLFGGYGLVVCCVLIVVHCLLFVLFSMFLVTCFLFGVCNSLFVVYDLLYVVLCLVLVVVCRLWLDGGCCRLLDIDGLLSVVFCSFVRCSLFLVGRFVLLLSCVVAFCG